MPISGKGLRKDAESLGWKFVSQKGSHVKMRKGAETIIIPMHKELKVGLEKALRKKIGTRKKGSKK